MRRLSIAGYEITTQELRTKMLEIIHEVAARELSSYAGISVYEVFEAMADPATTKYSMRQLAMRKFLKMGYDCIGDDWMYSALKMVELYELKVNELFDIFEEAVLHGCTPRLEKGKYDITHWRCSCPGNIHGCSPTCPDITLKSLMGLPDESEIYTPRLKGASLSENNAE